MNEAGSPIAVLLLEDDDLDAELVVERLRQGARSVDVRRARNEEDFTRALESARIDIILSDFSLPGYDGMAALAAARRTMPDVPFVFVSGAIGEERAIETLRRGATDYVLKDRLERLVPAVQRALDLVDERARRRAAETERDRLLISERDAREAAEKANRMKDEFLALVSHELRTPLNAILGWASLLATGDASPETVTKALATIERNARMQSRLIEDLLDISRIVTGKLQLHLATLAVASFVNPAVEAIRPAAAAKGVRLVVDPGHGVEVSGDVDRLQQVVWNLLSNAVKFTPRGGVTSVSVGEHGDAVEIVVSDTGAGIDASLLPYVFDRFRQGDATSTRRHAGLGLGLAIVRHLVELHGGTVNAASEGPGRGASFTIRLPVARAVVHPDMPRALPDGPAVPRSSLADVDAPLSLSGVHALVVDDEEDTRDLVAFILRTNGAEVTTAGSERDAFARLDEVRPTVIVSDIGMPEVDGYSFMRRLRARPVAKGGQVPALALTAYARELDRMEAEAAGFQRHLAKPVQPSLLVATVAELASADG